MSPSTRTSTRTSTREKAGERASARRGASLLEMMLVAGFVSFFALVLAGAVHTGTLVSRDTSVDVELADLGSRIVDEFQGRAMTALTSPVPPAVPKGVGWGPTLDPPHYAFQQRWALGGAGATFDGAILTPTRRETGWTTRFVFVQDTSVLGGFFREAALGVDVPAGVDTNSDGVIDQPGRGDGDRTDVFQLGRIEVQFVDAAGAVVPSERISFGGGRTFVLWNATNAPRLRPIFSRPEAGGFESRAAAVVTESGLQLNITVAHLPVPGADGAAEVRCLHLSRALGPR